ncbi:amidophosphoribosyltransferase [Beggiatoa sp. PS]|nr:amidophosphoribosyltransferase [Beggiatoa sp. PS]
MCGIIGIVGKSRVNQALYDGLTVLQHRGQDAAGIVTCENERLNLRKNNGLVRDVFQTRHMLNLRGNMGIGHVRYPTAGCASSAEAQPFYVNSPYGITLAHNGNLTNAEALKKDLFRDELRHINTDSDSEVLLNVFAHELHKLNKLNINHKDIFEAVKGVHRRCRGGYAVVTMITGLGIVAFRDPYGIRPVVFGKRKTPTGMEYVVASESVAIDILGFELVRDIAPGEAIFITVEGQLYTRQCADHQIYSPCIFEIVYMARPDSIIDGISVYKARLRMGKALAKKILRLYPNHDIDVVIPIPDTSRTAAVQLAHILNRKYREGFVKNRYIPRTFIMPGQNQRQKSVRQKLNAIGLEFKNKNVLLVDDSIVRGTTSEQIIQMARDAGAKKSLFCFRSPCGSLSKCLWD